MTYRNRELLNLVVVGMLTASGFAAVYLASQDAPEFSTTSLLYAALFLALFLAAHLLLRLRLPFADPYLLPIAGVLTALGLTEIYRIDPDRALRQGVWVVGGVLLFALVVLFLRDHRVLDVYKYTLGFAAIALLVLPALPVIGKTVNGARLWIDLGALQLQPGEFAKIFLVVFLAGYLRDNRELLSLGYGRLGVPSPKHFGPLLLVWGGAMLVLFQTNDLGGGLLYFSIFLAMLYVATARIAYVAVGLALFAAGSWAVYQVASHVANRIAIWLDPWQDPHDAGYQLVQSIYSIAAGGLFGTGLGRGVLVTPEGGTYIPYLSTDFIYAAIVQELGIAGGAALVLLYLVFVYRGFAVAMAADDGFSKLLATGLTAAIAIQAFIIIGGVSGLIPLTGVTLPLVSYGGSSIVANFLLVGLLLVVSNHVNEGAQR
ncbi:MAG: FtsW/RodA/SpoVE family cell cycle protein [Thermoleophilia bacterium]|nr:FtsW/RodA/SpoVE family cell cycle protein [Thermoleophilia bacterium]